jgi:hypothetical protein
MLVRAVCCARRRATPQTKRRPERCSSPGAVAGALTPSTRSLRIGLLSLLLLGASSALPKQPKQLITVATETTPQRAVAKKAPSHNEGMLNLRAANLLLRCVLIAVLALWALHMALGAGYWRQMREQVALEKGARLEAQRLLSERRQMSAIAVSNVAQVRCSLFPWQPPGAAHVVLGFGGRCEEIWLRTGSTDAGATVQACSKHALTAAHTGCRSCNWCASTALDRLTPEQLGRTTRTVARSQNLGAVRSSLTALRP